MWLHLDLDGIEMHFRITGYRKSIPERWDDQWCQVDLSLYSHNWLNYQISSSILLSCEVEEIRNKVSDLLEDKIQTEEELEFIEPDLTFILTPKKDLRKDPRYTYVAPGYEIVDVDAVLHVHLWNSGLTANYLSLCFNRNDLERLVTYLRYVTLEISKDAKVIQELVQKDVIRPNYNS